MGVYLSFFSQCETQLYANGELLGGVDIMKEMQDAGELADALKPPQA